MNESISLHLRSNCSKARNHSYPLGSAIWEFANGHRRCQATISACAQPVRARIFVDSSPLAERAVAERAGTGWFGKNTMILTPGVGSFTLLTTILVDVELEPDMPLGKSCGSCTRCITACPTGALVAPGVLNAPTCISFHTIENAR
ncbi:MAG: hypothetical protein EBT22_11525 [Chloroflexi bacterium]|nr:hypothetical protein [Chloroflexota bacterium]